MVHKLVKTVKNKSERLRKKLRSAVVRPKKKNNNSRTPSPSKEDSSKKAIDMKTEEMPIVKPQYCSAEDDGTEQNKCTPEGDNTSPKLDLMLSQKSKKSRYGDINIENDTDSSIKGNNDDVSNRSPSEIFADKAMFDSSQDSHDPYNILRGTNLPSDLENVSPIMFSALGSELPADVANSSTISSGLDINKVKLTTDKNLKAPLECDSAQELGKCDIEKKTPR